LEGAVILSARSCFLLVVFGVVVVSGTAQTAKVNSVLDMAEFVHDWQISKQFTLEVADAMPAEDYGFRPSAEEMTFGEQMLHIAVSNVYRFHEITGIPSPFVLDLSKPLSPDKANVVKVLGQSFDYVIDALPRITAEQLQHTWHIPSWKGRNDPDGRAMIMNMFVHTAHHRAQCEVYLRAKGIKPPDYTF
jgi:uncharacterized damage-inducible protein DinB